MRTWKHDGNEAAGTQQSAPLAQSVMRLIAARPLQFTLLSLLTAFIIAAVGVLATRSIWLDEAMLLRSVYEIGVLDFLHPLPYHNQASPFLPSVIIKLASEIAGTNFLIFRIIIFLFISICAVPLLIKLKRSYGMNALLAFLLVCTANLYNVIYYMTEIKHYGFEIGAMLVFMFWFIIYSENPREALSLRFIWIPLLAIIIGFSTIIIVPAFFLFLLVNFYCKYVNRSFWFSNADAARYLIGCSLMVLAAGFVYIMISNLTIYQMVYEEYKGISLIRDINILKNSIQNAFGHIFWLSIPLSLLSLFIHCRNIIIFNISIFFLSILIVVVFMKIAGVYPVIYGRHLVWSVPAGMILITMYIQQMLSRKDMFGLFLILMISLFALTDAAELTRINKGENTNNNALAAELKRIPPTDVLVSINSRPFVEIYTKKHPELLKHSYFGLMPGGVRSAPRDPGTASAAGRLRRLQAFSDWQFAQLPQIRSFLLVLSHDAPIEAPIEQEGPSVFILVLRNTLNNNGCTYESIFEEKKVQILKVSCAHRGEKEPGDGEPEGAR